MADNLTTFMYRLSSNLGASTSWNPLGLSRPVMGLLYLTSDLIYGAETCSLYEDDRRRINATEMDALRRSGGISELDRKTNEYIGGKMDAQDMIFADITRKQLIWYGHVERMDPTRLPKIMIHWKRGRPRRTWKDGLYTAMNGRDLRMGKWNNRRQWNMKVGRRRQTF
jgi:hypothetical protein